MKFKINARSEGKMKTMVKAGNFNLVIDEPESMGGTNEGANPLEFVLASLAGCYSIVGSIVAHELGIELKGLDIEIEGEMNPARFTGKSQAERAGFQKIEVSLKPETEADPELLEKWVELIEDRCPVTDNLTHSTPIEITVG